MTIIYPNMCYNRVCYKRTELYQNLKELGGFAQH